MDIATEKKFYSALIHVYLVNKHTDINYHLLSIKGLDTRITVYLTERVKVQILKCHSVLAMRNPTMKLPVEVSLPSESGGLITKRFCP